MPRNNTDPRVDAYIDALPEWQQGICRQVRDLAHAADPGLVETVKRTRQPYFVLKGNVCALLAAKDWVNIFLVRRRDRARPTTPHHERTREQDRPYHRDSPGRADQRARPHGHVEADDCEQPRRWLENAEIEAVLTNEVRNETEHERMNQSAGNGSRSREVSSYPQRDAPVLARRTRQMTSGLTPSLTLAPSRRRIGKGPKRTCCHSRIGPLPWVARRKRN